MPHQPGWIELYELLEAGRRPPPELVSLCKSSRTGIGETMLHWYAIEGEPDVLQKLIELGFDVNVQNEFGATPIMEAAMLGRWDVAEVLRRNGADLTIRNAMDEDIHDLLDERGIEERPAWLRAADVVTLRDVEEDDLETFFEQQCDPEASAMAAFPTRSRSAFFAHWHHKVLADESNVNCTILFRGRVAGNILCFRSRGRRLVGYWLGRAFWSRGIASRALRQFVEHFRERPLFAIVAEHNAGSIRVLEKCGFERSGERSDDVDGDGVEEFVYVLAR